VLIDIPTVDCSLSIGRIKISPVSS